MGEMEYLRRMTEISCDTCCITIESDGKTLTHEPNCKLAALAEENALLRKALEDLHVLLDFDEPIRVNEVQMFDDPCLINEAYAQAKAALEVKP